MGYPGCALFVQKHRIFKGFGNSGYQMENQDVGAYMQSLAWFKVGQILVQSWIDVGRKDKKLAKSSLSLTSLPLHK